MDCREESTSIKQDQQIDHRITDVACKIRRIFKRTIQVTAIAVLLSACSYPFAAANPDSVAPIILSEEWHPSKKEQNKVNAIPYEQYQNNPFPQRACLGELILYALKNNPNTYAAWADTLKAAASFGVSRNDFYPSIDINGNFTRAQQSVLIPSQGNSNLLVSTWTGGASASYTIFDFGSRLANSESALQALFATTWTYNQEIQNIIQLVTNDYYNYLYQEANQIADEQNVIDAGITFQAAEKKLLTGVNDVSDVIQAKTHLLQFQVELVNQKQSTKNSLVKLVSDLGLSPDLNIDLQGFPEVLPGREYLMKIDHFITLAKEFRPELASKKASVIEKTELVRKAERDQWPVITGNFNISDTNYSSQFGNAYQWAGKVQMNFPLFKGYFYRNKIREAKADLKIAASDLKESQDNVLKNVVSYYNDYKYALEKLSYTEAYLEAAEKEFEITLSNYRAGTGDILQVLTSQTSLADARSRQVGSVKDLFTSLTNLAYSTGSLTSEHVIQNNRPYAFQFEDNY